MIIVHVKMAVVSSCAIVADLHEDRKLLPPVVRIFKAFIASKLDLQFQRPRVLTVIVLGMEEEVEQSSRTLNCEAEDLNIR